VVTKDDKVRRIWEYVIRHDVTLISKR